MLNSIAETRAAKVRPSCTKSFLIYRKFMEEDRQQKNFRRSETGDSGLHGGTTCQRRIYKTFRRAQAVKKDLMKTDTG